MTQSIAIVPTPATIPSEVLRVHAQAVAVADAVTEETLGDLAHAALEQLADFNQCEACGCISGVHDAGSCLACWDREEPFALHAYECS